MSVLLIGLNFTSATVSLRVDPLPLAMLSARAARANEHADLLNRPAVPRRFAGQRVYRVALPVGVKALALTFDDGPWPGQTERVLQILWEKHVKATFFVVGRNVAHYPKLVRQEIKEGHAVGNHSFSHPAGSLSSAAAEYELDHTADLIEQAAGIRPHLFRPPYGALNTKLAGLAEAQGYASVLWSISTADTTSAAAPVLARNVVYTPQPGDIVLMHDGGGNHSRTIRALPWIIDGCRKQGYVFVTVPELLQLSVSEQRLPAPADLTALPKALSDASAKLSAQHPTLMEPHQNRVDLSLAPIE